MREKDFKKGILKKYVIVFFAFILFFIPITYSGSHLNTPPEIAVTNAADLLNFTWTGIGDALEKWIGGAILTFGGAVTWLGGTVLDTAIEWTIIDLAEHMEGGTRAEGGLGYTIQTVWSVVRDICNLVFIAGFLYVGVMSIFDSQRADTKRFLTKIIVGALLINFSLFFTQIIVDFSNFTAVQIYDTLKGDMSISTAFINALGVATLFTPDNNTLVEVTGGGSLWFYIIGFFFLIIAGIVLAAGGIMLIGRFIAIILIMMFSPVLFAATVFQETDKYSKKIWSALIDNAFFAPVYLFLLLISLSFITSTLGSLNGAGMADAIRAGKAADMIDVIIRYMAAIAFLMYSLEISKSMGSMGSEVVMSNTKKLSRMAAGGVTGLAGRYTFGLAGNYVAKKQDELRKSDRLADRNKARLLRYTGINALATNAKKATYGGSISYPDYKKEREELARARHDSGEKRKVETSIDDVAAARNAGLQPTDPQKIKMEQALAGASTEQIVKLLKKYKPSDPQYQDIVATISNAQYENVLKSKEEDFDGSMKNALKTARSTTIRTGLVNDENEKRSANGQSQNATLADVIGKASGKDLDTMDFETEILPNAGKLSSKQIDDMTLTETAKKRVKDARKQGLLAELRPTPAGSTPASARTLLSRFKETEVAKLPAEILTDRHVIDALNSNILSKILDNDDITKTDRDKIKQRAITMGGANAFNGFFNTPNGLRF